jgi:hypothetical protein
MAKSTKKATNFFEQRKNATKTAVIVNKAAATGTRKNKTLELLLSSDNQESAASMEQDVKASGKKVDVTLPSMPTDLKKFIEQNHFTSSGKINANLPVEIDNRLQIAVLQLKNKYGLNNRQINKTILLSYIVDKALLEDELFKNLP